jgi:solute carrier family 39 (zinc transporter), member 1/2/3
MRRISLSISGIGIGALLTSGPNADNLQVPNVILQGLATGTLLYVIFFEVLSKDRSGLLPFLSVLGGFLIMFGLQYIGESNFNE